MKEKQRDLKEMRLFQEDNMDLTAFIRTYKITLTEPIPRAQRTKYSHAPSNTCIENNYNCLIIRED